MKYRVLHAEGVVGPVTFTPPENQNWYVLHGHSILTTVAGGLSRRWYCTVLDPDGHVITDVHAGASQPASNVYHYSVKQGIFRETVFIDNDIEIPLASNLIVPTGGSIVVQDSAGIDIANDTYEVHFAVIEGNLNSILSLI